MANYLKVYCVDIVYTSEECLTCHEQVHYIHLYFHVTGYNVSDAWITFRALHPNLFTIPNVEMHIAQI